jgi:rhamnogalacturonyl hydrolase YesR
MIRIAVQKAYHSRDMTRHLSALVAAALLASPAPLVASTTPGRSAPAAPAALTQVAALRGEPAIVSAAGITRRDSELETIENPGAFEVSTQRRLVIVGGLDGEARSARAVIEAVRWMKTRAPLAIRRQWVVSALPLANPDRQTTPLVFPPPEKGDDPDLPETRYIWRWVVFQAPDTVVVVTTDQSNAADALVGALRVGRWAPGPVPATAAGPEGLIDTLSLLLTTRAAKAQSPLHRALLARAARPPLEIARTLAAKYPQQAIASYIPSVAWASMLRLSAATGDDEWHAKVREQTAPWLSGAKEYLGERTPLTSIAGGLIFAELAAADHDAAAGRLANQMASLAAAVGPDDSYAHGSGWTDDMFMATSVLARVADLTRHGPAEAVASTGAAHRGAAGAAGDGHAREWQPLASRMLQAYAARLQRPDGIFVHGPQAPHAWGRGNGFAALGLMEALTRLPADAPDRNALAAIVKRHMAGLRANVAPDGMFREVIDEPGSYREETATAMLLTAMARGIRLGWLDRSYAPAVRRSWRALAAHVAEDGSLVDVCASTGGGATKRYYLDRPALNGFDDRGGAMALQAAMEMFDFEKSAGRSAKRSTQSPPRPQSTPSPEDN